MAKYVFGMTAQMKALLDFIRAYQSECGYPPSYQEMNDALGLHSKSGIHRLICALEQRGQISRLPDRARAIFLVDDNYSIRFPAELDDRLRRVAETAGVTPEAFIEQCVRDTLCPRSDVRLRVPRGAHNHQNS